MSFQKILVGIDNSQLGSKVFATALELAQSNNATIMLLHCLTTNVTSGTGTSMTVDVGLNLGLVDTNYETQQILVERQIEEAQVLLKDYSQDAMRQGVLTLSNYKVGEAGTELCEMAKGWGADLIVVGRHSHKGLTEGLTEALLGSVSNYVVHNAPCSVLVIQQGEPK